MKALWRRFDPTARATIIVLLCVCVVYGACLIAIEVSL